MNWKDRLLPASFRGVPFFLQSSDYGTGRRSTQHEFPDRDLPFAEDLGRISDSFQVDGHLIGDDYFTQRERLVRAFQAEGPGELIHPYYGVRRVQVGAVSFRDDQTEGRITRFTVTFREAGEPRFPRGANDKGAKLLEETSTALDEAQSDFEERFSTDGLPGFGLDAARGWIGNAQDSFNTATKDVATAADGVAELAFSSRNLVAETEDLLKSPAKLANRLLGSASLLSGAVTNARDAFSSYKELFGFGSEDPEPIETTPTRKRIAQNKVAFDEYLTTVSAIKASEEAANADWASLSEAQEARDEVLEVLDQRLETTDNDELYQSLVDVRATLVSLLPDEDSDLPVIDTVGVEATTDSLNLAYDLFESVENEPDIIERNNIDNPAFIVAGKSLEVLNGQRRS